MECKNIGNLSFGARLTTGRYGGAKLRKYLEHGIMEFEKQTQNKPGWMTLRASDIFDTSAQAEYFFWNGKTAPRNIDKYAQKAITTKDFLKHLIVEQSPKEQADIFESIFDALQVIPKVIKRNERVDSQFMSNLTVKINEALGKNKELLSPMFEHITDSTSVKKLRLEDIDF